MPEGMGSAEVPIFSVPPELTEMLPPMTVKVLESTRLKYKVPLMVVVLPISPPESVVTTLPAAIVTGVQELGTTFRFQVLGCDQPPEVTLVKAAAAARRACRARESPFFVDAIKRSEIASRPSSAAEALQQACDALAGSLAE